MSRSPNHTPCRLVDGRVSPPVLAPAQLTRDFPADKLADVEQAWSPARVQLAEAMAAAGLHLESGHWDWRSKAWSVDSNTHRLIAVECEGEAQGLMALAVRPRQAVLPPSGSVVYVDYLESAPWNLRQPIQAPRFLGVGTVLIGEAVRESQRLGLGGRVGLHALPQAERFYSERCRMTRCGADRDYYELVYFEYPDGVAAQWLTDMGMSE